MNDVPGRYRGVWARTLLQTPQQRDERTFVRWLQTGSWHADLRVPETARQRPQPSDADLATQAGFCGITRIERPLPKGAEVCTWLRRFDYQPPRSTPDAGHIVFASPDRILETGVHGHYLEVWERLPDSLGRSIVLRGPQEGIRSTPVLLLIAGRYMMRVRPRSTPWPGWLLPDTDLADLLVLHPAQSPAWLGMEISFGTLENERWTVQRSTIYPLEGNSFACALVRLDDGTAMLAGSQFNGRWSILEWSEPEAAFPAPKQCVA